MPETFPEWDDTENRLVDRDYYSLAEIAPMLHMGKTKAQELLKSERWPHLRIGSRVWVSERDFRVILAGMRQNDTGVPEADDAPSLGIPLPVEDPWLNDEGEADQDPGGVR